jgi:hypothetical protein
MKFQRIRNDGIRAITANGISYDAEIAHEAQSDGTLDLDNDERVFVNYNGPTHRAPGGEDRDDGKLVMKAFEALFMFDKRDESGFPLHTYLHNGRLIAWFDEQRCEGYIA